MQILLRPPLVPICKTFLKSHLEHDDIINDQACNASFHQNLEKIWYNSALAIT